MNANRKIIGLDQLKAGDVILCCGDDKLAKKIANETNSKYTHSAICYSPTEAVEAGSGGIDKVPIAEVVARYPYVAVFRSPVAWSNRQISEMNRFLDNVIATHRRYNFRGAWRFTKNKEKHELNLLQKANAYFAHKLKPESFDKERYFCSELVADCFRASGFIDESAAVLFKGSVYSPGDLGREPTFGTFVGYLPSDNQQVIPEDDEFFHRSTYAEIFNS